MVVTPISYICARTIYFVSCNYKLAYWSQDKMANIFLNDILQLIHWMKTNIFWLKLPLIRGTPVNKWVAYGFK